MAEKEPAASSPRLRLSPDLLAAAIRARASTRGAVPPSRPNKPAITGSMYERSEVLRILGYIGNLAPIKGGYSWQALLSGETPVSAGGVRLNPSSVTRGAKVAQDSSQMSFHKFIAGPDYRQLGTEEPMGRYKFYHSFQDKTRGESYLAELVKRAAEQGLSLSMKSFDHDYDGMDVYTHHFKEVSALIEELYPRHAGAFYGAEHFLQGPLNSVNPRHIGWAQEPEAGVGQRSHSGRMGQIGAALDMGGLSEAAYRQGCQTAGVRPDQPWLLTHQYEEQLAQAYRSKLHA